MQLEAKLLAVKSVAAGQAIGYGGAFVTARETRIGLVGFGYGDGYPRTVSGDAEVLIGGVPAAIIGRVAMDITTVDLRRHPHAAAGDTVVLWGDGLRVDQVARHAATIAHELLCKVSDRVPRLSTQLLTVTVTDTPRSR